MTYEVFPLDLLGRTGLGDPISSNCTCCEWQV